MSAVTGANWLKIFGIILPIIGSILMMVTQVYVIQIYMELSSLLPVADQNQIGMIMFLLQLLLLNIFIALSCSVLILLTLIINHLKSGAVGGLLAIFFAIPGFFVTGTLGIIGSILVIIGGLMSIISTIRLPKES